MKLATRLMPTVAAKKVSAAIIVSGSESTRSTISAGLVSASPNSTRVPAVIIGAINEKKATFNGKPSRLPSFIWRSVFTKRVKSPKLITTAAKYATMVPTIAIKAAIELPLVSLPPLKMVSMAGISSLPA